MLRADGRRRLMEAVSQLGDGPESRSLLGDGLSDELLEVRAAAGVGLAGWGDERALPVLLDASKTASVRQVALQGLRRLATPERRVVFLNALQAEGRDVLAPVVLATFPEPEQDRLAALHEVAARHQNPFARAFALEVLVEQKDPAVRELARAALDDGGPSLRPVALAALGASGGDDAASEFERVLQGDPKDAVDVARGLYRVGREGAIDAAARIVRDAKLKPATRAAAASEVLGRLAEATTPAPYKTPGARQKALEALRAVLDEHQGATVVAAVEAIGKIGEPGTDVELLLILLRAPDPAVTPAVVRALGQLGGEYAATKLVELIGNDPGLREEAARALGGFAEKKDVPVEEVINLLESEDLATRKAALVALTRLSGSQDALGYDPAGAQTARAHGIQRWRDWWTARRDR